VARAPDAPAGAGIAVFEPFGDEAACLAWLWKSLYAPDGASAICKRCRTVRRFHRVGGRRAYACDSCGAHVYPTAGTFMENSRLNLAAWFTGAMLARPGEAPVTAQALARRLAVNYKTALRVRSALLRATGAAGPDAALLERLRREAGAALEADGDEASAAERAERASASWRFCSRVFGPALDRACAGADDGAEAPGRPSDSRAVTPPRSPPAFPAPGPGRKPDLSR